MLRYSSARSLPSRPRERPSCSPPTTCQSVEELCDDITLINRAEVVLSGQTAEIRQAHGSHTARIVYEGEISPTDLSRLNILEHEEREYSHVLRIQLQPEEELRSIIAQLPSAIHLQSIELEYPSMHEIFLATVQAK